MVWSSVLGDGIRIPVESVVDAGVKPLFAFSFGNLDEEWTIGGFSTTRITLEISLTPTWRTRVIAM